MCRCCCWRIRRCRRRTSRSSSPTPRSRRTPLFYGSTGPGSIMHLMGEVLKRDTGIKMDHVPFRGAAPLVHGAALRPHPVRRRPALELARACAHRRAQGAGGRHHVGRAAGRADGARARLPESGAARLERLLRAQGHARGDARAPARGDRGGREASGRAQAHGRRRRRAVGLDARPRCATCCASRSPRCGPPSKS